MYVYIYVYVYIYTYICMYVCIYTHSYIYMYVFLPKSVTGDLCAKILTKGFPIVMMLNVYINFDVDNNNQYYKIQM
jgi:hypothetical protein